MGGVVTVVLGAVLVLFADSTAFSIGALRPIGFGLLGFGWVVLIYAIVKRTRYASRRRAELLATHVESPSDG